MKNNLLNALVAAILFCLCDTGYAATAVGPGMCPVMPGRQAKSNLSVDYQGKTYYLCCTSCVKLFKRNPQKYITKT